MDMEKKESWVIIGNWGMKPDPEGYGLTFCRYMEDGSLLSLGTFLTQIHAGKLSLDEKKGVLYCVDETDLAADLENGTGGGRVFAVSIDPAGASLEEINSQYTFAPLPCYVCRDPQKPFLLVSNHSGGKSVISARRDDKGKYSMEFLHSDASVILYPIMNDGGIGAPLDICKIYGHGLLPQQDMPHLHSVVHSDLYDLYFVADKGCNRIYSFAVEENGLRKKGEIALEEGSAPRYGCVLQGKPVYVCNYEECSALTSFTFTENGEMRELCSVNILPDQYDISIKRQSSDLVLAKRKERVLLYNITRGINYISVVELNPETGALTLLQNLHFEATSFCGGGARALCLSPDGRFLYVCVTDDGDIHRFALEDDGTLRERDIIQHLGHPAGMVFYSTFE